MNYNEREKTIQYYCILYIILYIIYTFVYMHTGIHQYSLLYSQTSLKLYGRDLESSQRLELSLIAKIHY